MNDELEELLKRQQLRQPSATLDSRIAASCAGWRGSRLLMGASAIAALAACLVIAASLMGPSGGPHQSRESASHSPAAATPDDFIRVEQVWSQITPGDLLVTVDDEPVRAIRVQRMHQTRWVNEKKNVQIELTVPEDQVVLVSAPIQ